MDPELLQLYLSAAGSPSGASRTNNILDDVLFAYIAGGVNPQTFAGPSVGGGSSQLMQNYMSDPNPALQQVIAHIQGGTDPYRLSSFVDSIQASMPDEVANTGFQPSDFKNLALAMNKEFTGGSSSSGGSGGGGSQGFNFSRAGLSNPLDLYDMSNVPLSDEALGLIAKQREVGSKSSTEKKQYGQKARTMMTKLSESGDVFREYDAKKMSEALSTLNYQTSGDSEAHYIVTRLQQLTPNEGTVDKSVYDEFYEKLSDKGKKKYRDAVKPKLDAQKPEKMVVAGSVDVNSPDFWAWRKNVENARKSAYNEQEAARQEMAVREGALTAAEAAGRTPLGDELKSRLSVLAKLKKK